MQKIRFELQPVGDNPHMSGGMPHGSSHFKVRFKRGGKQLTCFFSQGPAHYRDPKPGDILECLVSDMYSVECSGDFEDWARDLGYESFEDYPRAKRTYELCKRQGEKLRKILSHRELEKYSDHERPDLFLQSLCLDRESDLGL